MAVMSKLSIRARNVDSNKSLPIIRSEDLPDVDEFSILPRNAVLLSSGMEKEEEEETHLQEALSALQVALRSENEAAKSKVSLIPIPESNISVQHYEDIYSTGYKCTKQYLHYRENLLEESCAEYDADSEDEAWLQTNFSSSDIEEIKFHGSQSSLSSPSKATLNGSASPVLSKTTFETMMEKLERSSGQHVTTVAEAKALLQDNDDIVMHVYDYWLAKRLRWRHTLMPCVKVDRKDLVGDPYVAFRKRMDRVQTRKNRKNDEISFEKMLRLRKDFHRALEVIEMMKERENAKKQLLINEMDILALRKENKDFDNVLYNEVMQFVRSEMESRRAMKKVKTFSIIGTPSSTVNSMTPPNGLKTEPEPPEENLTSALRRKRKKLRKEKLENMKLKDKSSSSMVTKSSALASSQLESVAGVKKTGADDLSTKAAGAEQTRPGDRQFVFRRVPNLLYHAPLNAVNYQKLQAWPNLHLHYSLTNISTSCDRSLNVNSCEYSNSKCLEEKDDHLDVGLGGAGGGHVRRYLDTNRNIGYCRRRVGRGGRIVFDRVRTPPFNLDSFGGNNNHTSSAVSRNNVANYRGEENEKYRNSSGISGTATAAEFAENSSYNSPTSECLPNYLWSHYLDHSYSLFSAEYPQDIPVYLPKAKRHQSLPPSCNLNENESSIRTGENCVVSTKEASIKQTTPTFHKTDAGIANLTTNISSTFSGHHSTGVAAVELTNARGDTLTSNSSYVNGGRSNSMIGFSCAGGGVDSLGGLSVGSPATHFADSSTTSGVVSNQNISTNTSPLLLAGNYKNTLKQQPPLPHTNNQLWRQSMPTALSNSPILAVAAISANAGTRTDSSDVNFIGLKPQTSSNERSSVVAGSGVVHANEQSLGLRDREPSLLSSSRMSVNAAAKLIVGVGAIQGSIGGTNSSIVDRVNCVVEKSNGGVSSMNSGGQAASVLSRPPLYTHSNATQGPQRANTAALLLNNFVSSDDCGSGRSSLLRGETVPACTIQQHTPSQPQPSLGLDTYLKLGSPNINNNNKPIAIGLPSRRNSSLNMASDKEILGCSGGVSSPGGASNIYDNPAANSPGAPTATDETLFQGVKNNKDMASGTTLPPKTQHTKQAHKRRLLNTSVVNSPSPTSQNNANQMLNTQMSTTNTLY